jgi:RHS repeat-associated protein
MFARHSFVGQAVACLLVSVVPYSALAAVTADALTSAAPQRPPAMETGSNTPSPYALVTTLAGEPGDDDGDDDDDEGGKFFRPLAVAVTSAGVVYVADSKHDQIRRVTAAGAVTVYAGTGKNGYKDGAAAIAQFKAPGGIAYDEARAILYVADTGNRRIRKIVANGTVSTFAGNDSDLKEPIGLALDAAGNLYVSDRGLHRIVVITPAGASSVLAGSKDSGFRNGPAAQARFKQPEAVASTPDGIVYVADTGNDAIRRIGTPVSGVRQVTTVIDGRSNDARGITITKDDDDDDDDDDDEENPSSLSKPQGIAIDPSGNLIVADTGNDRIRRIVPGSQSAISTIAGSRNHGFGNGPALSARFNEPAGLAVRGAVYIADAKNNAIRILHAPLAVDDLSPRSGAAGGGTVVRIFGTGFVAGATQVLFGTSAATNVTFVSPAEVTAVAPAHAGGAVGVTVTTAAKSVTLPNAYTYGSTAVLTAIAVTPSTTTIAAGSTQAFIATGTYSDGSTANLTSAVTWSSNDVSVATVAATGIATGLRGGLAAIKASLGTISGSAQLTVQPRLTSIAVTPAATTVRQGQTQAFIATGTYDDATTRDLTTSAAWSSSNGARATINAAGIATTLQPGSVTITASLQGVNGTAQLTIQPIATQLAIAPSSVSIAQNATQQLTATIIDSDGTTRDVTASAAWTTSNSSVASVVAGNVTGITPGAATITATAEGLSATASVTVTKVLTAIVVSPATLTLAHHATGQLTATATYSDGSTGDVTSSATWTTSNAAAASVANGTVSGEAPGIATITATLQTFSATATVTVGATASTLAIAPGSATIDHHATTKLTATLTYSDGTTADATSSATWTSSNDAIAAVVSGAVTGNAPGTVTIIATTNGVTATATITINRVLTAIAVDPAALTLAHQATGQLTATATYSDGTTSDVTSSAAWSSSDDAIAQVTNGTVTATAPGSATIAATLETFSATATVTVTATMTSLAVVPSTATIAAGATRQLVAQATYSDGSTGNVTATWTSSVEAVATVSSTGLVTAVAGGTTVITASTGGYTATASTTVTAAEGLPPDPALIAPPIDPTRISNIHDTTTFLYTGTDAIQRGVAPGTIERLRAAVLRGLVSTRDGNPLPGVRVTITGHPEYGHTLTRADGRYDMAVNGGGPLTIHLAKSGYIPVDRIENVPWNRFFNTEDAAMVPYDTAVHTVALGRAQAQIARGSVITDDAGTRQATLIFQPNTNATMTMANGGTQVLEIANVRATEFTVGANGPMSMPAPLPPQSGYTYCVELSADEAVAAAATRVDFDKPVAFYLENFLTFPSGSDIPTGYYDRTCNKWVAAPNGRVVMIVSIVENRAYLDIDGDGNSDDSDALIGTTIAEREALATLYGLGASLWRVPIPHFTPWDHNWPFGPPPDAIAPPGGTAPTCEKPGQCSLKEGGSIIECEAQNLGEIIPITGTPFSLSYNSSRVPGRTTARHLTVEVSSNFIPSSVRRVEVTVDIAGHREKRQLPVAPNQKFDYVWNQKDPYGRNWQGSVPASVSVAYVYDGAYQDIAANEKAFAKLGSGTPIDGNTTTREITVSRNWHNESGVVGTWDAKGAGFGSWTFDAQQFYDSSSNTLETGSGARRTAQAGSLTIRSLGQNGGSGARGISTNAGLQAESIPPNATTITADAAGNLYVASELRVYRVTPDGTSTVLAGNGTADYNGESIPATGAGIDPAGLAIGPDGALYIADEFNRRVRRVASGIITTVAGNGEPGYSGDGNVPATQSPLTPNGIAVFDDGTLYVTDRVHHIVRAIDLCTNEMWSVAGSGQDGGSGLRGMQADAGESITGPTRIAVTPKGKIYIVAEGNSIHRMQPDGQIHQLTPPDYVCSGYSCFPGQSGSLLVRGETLYYTSPSRYTIDAIVGDVSKRIAGTGVYGATGDGGFAQAATLSNPRDLFMRGDGKLYVVDGGAIRVIEQPFPGLSDGETAIATPDASAYFVFDEDGRHIRTVDALFGVTRFAFGYNSDGYLTSVTDVDGNLTRIERSGREATAIVAPGGQRTMLAYDGDGYLRSITNPAGEAHRFTYGFLGLLASMTDPRSHQYTFEYDADGRLHVDRDPAGGSKTLVRTGDARNFSVQLTTAEGRSESHTVNTYEDGTEYRNHTDGAGLMTSTERRPSGESRGYLPDGTFVRIQQLGDPRFGVQALLPSITASHPGGFSSSNTISRSFELSPDPSAPVLSATFTTTLNGRFFQRFFDGASRTATVTSPEGRTVTYRYDERGHITSVEVPGFAPVSVAYDGRGLVIEVVQGDRSMTMSYDTRQRLTTLTHPLTGIVSFGYDNADRVISQTSPGNRTVSLTRDANGNITSLTPPGRPPHLFTFDAVDMPAVYTPPGGSVDDATLDLDHRPTLVRRGDGRPVGITYDGQDRVSALSVERGDYTFTWNPNDGAVDTATSPDGNTLAFAYIGSLPESTSWSGDEVNGRLIRYYDGDQRLQSEVIECVSSSGPSCNTVEYQYDHDGLIFSAGELLVQHDPASGVLTGSTFGPLSETYGYNATGEVTDYAVFFAGLPFFTQELTRDTAGRITTNMETIEGMAATFEYGYDTARRLSSVKKNGFDIAVSTYDDNGNRLTRVTPLATQNGTYGSDDRVLTYGETTYSHSAAGDLQAVTDNSGTTLYSYDEFGNLIRVRQANGDEIDYVIDGQNRRIAKKRNGEIVQRLLYRSGLQIAAELDGSGNVDKRFVYATRTNVPDVMLKSDGTYRIVSDHLGSVRVVIDIATGAIMQRLDYDELGNVIQDTAPGFQPFGYAGGLYDRDTRLVRFGARDYDPRAGRWTAKDPINFDGGDSNLYNYAFGDPINLIDPTGLATIVGRPKSPYTQRLKDALEFFRKELRDNPSPQCDAYFQAQPNPEFKDFRKALLTDGGPPYIRAADKPRGVSGDTAAYSQQGAPWTYMTIFKDFMDKNRIGNEVPSVILHELGHLARQDTTDNEPQQFFDACVCGSINPGKKK